MNYLGKLRDHLRASVRAKLLFMVLLPLLTVLPILVGLVVYWGNTSYQKLLIFKINSDLVVAHEYFRRVMDNVGNDVNNVAGSSRLITALNGADRREIGRLLGGAREEHRLDFLNLLTLDGRVVASGNELSVASGYGDWPVVKRAGAGDASTTIDIFSPQQLADIDPRLRERAHVPVVPTQNVMPSDKKAEERGMIIHAAAPVFNPDGRQIGVLQGGLMLNRNLDFVDTINGIVYREGSLPLGSKGTATLFLDDVRIATNVRLFQGERALGTRVSRQVHEKVLGKGETWLDRAFVVNDWYVSGYEPVIDSLGRRVGMLYVGYLDAPFEAAKFQALAVIVALFVVISAGGAFLSLRWARTIFRPLERMNQTMNEVEAGNPDARVGAIESQDEIGDLAAHFDRLLASLQARNRELKHLADELDRKVIERTRELAQANQELRDAQRQLVMSEKLAAIGELTAGVAHEINNPTAVIQGNLDVLKEVLGPKAGPVMQEIRLIDEQVNRIREIVTKLLQFARPSEFAGYVEQVDVSGVLDDCLVLVRHHLQKTEIEVVKDYRARRSAGINRNELQQVLINLLVNAVHAMGQGGRLTLRSADWDDKGVAIAVKDTGHGIRPEDVSRIFDPFFSTKRVHGTGLGLSISYALVERYGGAISVESAPGQGAEFTVWLLTEPRFLQEAGAAGEAAEVKSR
ncbi:MAG: cache domain-containing protein [Betaproteobacteria bacterium]|nr:cache domain-containing protein [Betaproteobacteria bacterium]